MALVWIKGSGWLDENTERWEVEWQTTHPGFLKAATDDERDAIDPADHPFHFRHFPTKALAVKFARGIIASAHWGCATVAKVVPELWEEGRDAAFWERVPSTVEEIS